MLECPLTLMGVLDIVISRDDDDFVSNVAVNGMTSDHAIFDIQLAIRVNQDCLTKKITYRKWKSHSYAQAFWSLTS